MDLLHISTVCALLERIVLLNLMHKELIVCSEIFLGYKPKHSEWDQPGDLLQNDPNRHRGTPGHRIYHLFPFWDYCTWESYPSSCRCIRQSVLLEPLGSMAEHLCCRQLDCTETGDLTGRDSIPGIQTRIFWILLGSFKYQINTKDVRKEDQNNSA